MSYSNARKMRERMRERAYVNPQEMMEWIETAIARENAGIGLLANRRGMILINNAVLKGINPIDPTSNNPVIVRTDAVVLIFDDLDPDGGGTIYDVSQCPNVRHVNAGDYR